MVWLVDQAPVTLSVDEGAAHAGSKVLVEVDDNSAKIVGNGKEATVNRALYGKVFQLKASAFCIW